MLGQILNLIQINKETPDAVGYQVFTPQVYNPPKELLDNLSSDDRELLSEIRTLHITVDNFSSNTQKNIRVIYSGEISLKPEVNSQSRDISIECENLLTKKEILVKEILPGESLVISIHNPDDKFEVKNVLIGDKLVTTTMQKLANAKRSPSSLWAYIVCLLVMGVSAYSIISTKNYIDERQVIDARMGKLYKKLGYSSCQPSIFENSIGKEKELERAFKKLTKADQDNTLLFNDVDTYDQLKVQDKVVFCTFSK